MATTHRYVRTMLTMQTAVLLRPQLASGQLNTRKLPIDIQFCVKMQSMPNYNGVDWMIKRIARWILRAEINYLEHDWWVAGVNQHKYEPETCGHGLKSYGMYWHGIEGGEE